MNIALIMLAAGASRRFGTDDKLLAAVGGEPLAVRTARVMGAARVTGVSVHTRAVVTARDGPVAQTLTSLPPAERPRLVVNPQALNGMGTSIAAGIASLSPSIDGALITPADMPFLTARLIEQLMERFQACRGECPVHPLMPDGSSVGPVLWPRRYFSALVALTGDAGGQSLLVGETTFKIQMTEADVHLIADIDTPGDLARVVAAVGKLPGT
jgi:molybdenum cofactor cytidylyltransferase